MSGPSAAAVAAARQWWEHATTEPLPDPPHGALLDLSDGSIIVDLAGVLDAFAEAQGARNSLRAHIARLRAGLHPFAAFADQWDAQPLHGLSDDLYTIHGGTEWKATLRLSDCRAARALLAPQEPTPREET